MFKKYFLLFVFSFTVYIAHTVITGQGLYGDGNGYYSYTNTLYFQKNLDFTPIYDYLINFQGRNGIFSRLFWDRNTNPFLIGTGLVWIPSLAFISAVNNIFGLHASRFDLIYETGPGITGIILMLGGLYFLEQYLLNFFSKKAVLWTVLAVFFTSSVLYYTASEPALSHQPAFFIICFLLWWTYRFKKTYLNLFILGFISGLLATVRSADIVLLLPVYYRVKPKLKDYEYIFPGFIIAFLPQLLCQQFMYGSIFVNPYLNGQIGSWQFNLAHLFQYLFSPMRGLFLWTPILLVGFWGLIKSGSKVYLLAIFALWLVTSSWSAYLSAGFGQRYSFSAIPFFAYGLAFLFQKFSLRKIISTISVFAVWNALLLKNFYFHKDLFIQSGRFTFTEFISFMSRLK